MQVNTQQKFFTYNETKAHIETLDEIEEYRKFLKEPKGKHIYLINIDDNGKRTVSDFIVDEMVERISQRGETLPYSAMRVHLAEERRARYVVEIGFLGRTVFLNEEKAFNIAEDLSTYMFKNPQLITVV